MKFSGKYLIWNIKTSILFYPVFNVSYCTTKSSENRSRYLQKGRTVVCELSCPQKEGYFNSWGMGPSTLYFLFLKSTLLSKRTFNRWEKNSIRNNGETVGFSLVYAKSWMFSTSWVQSAKHLYYKGSFWTIFDLLQRTSIAIFGSKQWNWAYHLQKRKKWTVRYRGLSRLS